MPVTRRFGPLVIDAFGRKQLVEIAAAVDGKVVGPAAKPDQLKVLVGFGGIGKELLDAALPGVAAHAADVGEDFRMVQANAGGMPAAHRVADDGAMFLV